MESEFLRLDAAAARHHIDPRKLDRLIRKSNIPRFTDPLDGRRYVVRSADLETLLTPQPLAVTLSAGQRDE